MSNKSKLTKSKVAKDAGSVASEPKRRENSEAVESMAGKAPAETETKSEKVVSLLRRDNGATLEELTAATGWQSHSTRAALTGLKKKGHGITSDKVDGVRRYRAVDSK
jgi:hypothetical protein